MSEQITDSFDRILGALTGLPDHRLSRASTVTTVMPILGNAQSYIVRTMRTDKGEYIGFVEMIDAQGKIRVAIPAKAMAALYRQRDSLVKQTRASIGRERYAREHPEWQPKRKVRKARKKK